MPPLGAPTAADLPLAGSHQRGLGPTLSQDALASMSYVRDRYGQRHFLLFLVPLALATLVWTLYFLI